MNEGIEYVTLESALEAISYASQQDSFKQKDEARQMLVRRTFKTVGRAANLSGSAGGFTQAVFKGNEVKDGDWVYVEVK